jgi:hypothetical protein
VCWHPLILPWWWGRKGRPAAAAAAVAELYCAGAESGGHDPLSQLVTTCRTAVHFSSQSGQQKHMLAVLSLIRVICYSDHIHFVVCHWVALMLASKSLIMIQGAANARFLCASLCIVQFSTRVQSYFSFTTASIYLFGAYLRSLCVVHAI